tara:strand:+ start:67 stop:372 length:306 start_codon:yes stop_codon:yes gene_type:complete
MAQEKINFFKKNIFVVPVVASLVVGTFTSVKYVVNLTDTVRNNAQHIEKIQEKTDSVKAEQADIKADIARLEASMNMGEDLYRLLSEQVREHSYDIKDLNR